MKTLVTFVVVTVILVMTAGLSHAVSNGMPYGDPATIQRQYQALEAELADAKGALADAQAQLADCQARLANATEGRGQLAGTTASLRREVKNLRAKVWQLRQRLAATEAALRQYKKAKPVNTGTAMPVVVPTVGWWSQIPWWVWAIIILIVIWLIWCSRQSEDDDDDTPRTMRLPRIPQGMKDTNAGSRPSLDPDKLLDKNYRILEWGTAGEYYKKYEPVALPPKEVIRNEPHVGEGEALVRVRLHAEDIVLGARTETPTRRVVEEESGYRQVNFNNVINGTPTGSYSVGGDGKKAKDGKDGGDDRGGKDKDRDKGKDGKGKDGEPKPKDDKGKGKGKGRRDEEDEEERVSPV